MRNVVIAAKAAVQGNELSCVRPWIPAPAGMTIVLIAARQQATGDDLGLDFGGALEDVQNAGIA